jgi:SpoIID/LytB domain protein
MSVRALPSIRRPLAIVLVLLGIACTSSSVTGAVTAPSPTAPSSTASAHTAPSSTPPDATPNVATIRAGDGSLHVLGAYPHVKSRCAHPEQPKLDARYPGTLTVRRAGDGTLGLTVTLPFERYLEGIAEVPPTWPAAALEAQAIAARSYALSTTGWDGPNGATLQTPICSTTSCQVFRGIPTSPTPGIRRWYAAVNRTAGEVLADGGRPIDAVYFSTSNGHTYGNEDVFGSAPLPYLRPVAERDDGASPESHWRVPIPFADLARFLRAGDLWPAGTPISSAAPSGGSIVVSGGGASRTISVSEFDAAVNEWGPCLMPARYPTDSRYGSALPATIPSHWYTLASGGGGVVLTGRGWGHGVGMVQWGAYGKAREGWSAARILAYYYGGLTPQTASEPGLIHVRVADGLTALKVVPSTKHATVDGQPVRGSIVVHGGDRLQVEDPLPFAGSISRIRPALRATLVGRNWHAGCPVAIDDLRVVRVRYHTFTGAVETGPLVVHTRVAADVLGVFRRLYRAGFPINRIGLPPRYRPPRREDWFSTRDLTSSFNCRPATGNPGSLSQHSYGWAIDINPLENPYVNDGKVLRRAAKPFVDRTRHVRGMIHPGDAVVRSFAAIGWGWGGDWHTLKDYMHFSLTGR